MSAVAPFVEYLKQLQAKGQTHVPLDDPARKILRKFYVRATQPAHQQEQLEPDTPSSMSQAESTPAKVETPAPVTITGTTESEQLASLKSLCAGYQPLLSLNTLRKKLVFPTASTATDIMFIGEAPAYHDEQKGHPFAGPAGDKLNGILKAMGLSREQVHITNILKYRPANGVNQTTDNRPASQLELETSRPLIEREIELLKPKVIITLGAPAARFFTQSTDSLDELRGKPHLFKGIPLHTTYSPHMLLNNSDTTDRRKVWQDMLSVMELLNMSISEKQRGYFKPRG